MKAYSNGRFVNSYTNYIDACKELSRKYNVPCIDLNTLMVNHYNAVGYDTAKSYHLMGAVSGSTDGTHFCEKGADIIAGIVAKDVKDQGITGLEINIVSGETFLRKGFSRFFSVFLPAYQYEARQFFNIFIRLFLW